MAKINKQEIIQKLIDELQLYPGKDLIPTELAEKVLAVYQINTQEVTVKTPTAKVLASETSYSGAAHTIYTTPATGKLYLTNIVIATEHDGAGEQIQNVTVVIDGATVSIASQITASNNQAAAVSVNLQNPVLLDPGSIVQHTGSSDGGAESNITLIGYAEA